jgi:hypothetical protein
MTLKSRNLKNIGDFELQSSPDGESLVRIVVKLDEQRVQGNCGFGNPHSRAIRELNSRLSQWEYVPVIKTYTPDQFLTELHGNLDLMNQLRRGHLDDLVSTGLTRDLVKVDNSFDYKSEALKLIDNAITRMNENEFYVGSRALVAKTVIEPTNSNLSDEVDRLSKNDDFLVEFSALVCRTIIGTDKLRDDIYKKGQQLIETKGCTWTGQAVGWGMMAVSAHTDDQIQKIYEPVKSEINSNYIHSSANAVVAAAILGYGSAERRNEIYNLAKNRLTCNSWSINGRSIIAMGITADEGEARSEVYKLAEEKLKGVSSHGSDKHYMVALALTAQTPEERFKAFKLAEHYSDSDGWSKKMNGAAYISLGILAASDRTAAVKSVASLMQQDH